MNLEDLKKALNSSPGNLILHQLVVDTMINSRANLDEAKEYVNIILAEDKSNLRAKNSLLEIYSIEKKNGAVIILGIELGTSITFENKVRLAESLLLNNEIDQARNQYQEIKIISPEYSNDFLDSSLRVKETVEGQLAEENIDGIVNHPRINFDHVGGMTDLKEKISIKIIKPLKHPEIYKQYGKTSGGGILLYGPPGCGKTYLAKATAGEAKINFINVSLHDVLDMWIGQSEKNIHNLFEQARRVKPCIIFFDEIDALGFKRNNLSQSKGSNVINQLLSELDGFESNNEEILIIGATNTPWSLDEAIKRSGRFDEVIFVPPPDEEAREKIIGIHMADKPSDNINLNTIARLTNMYSGADIRNLINRAIEKKLPEALKIGEIVPIYEKDLKEEIKNFSPTTKEWFSNVKNYTLFANKSGIYDEVIKYMRINNL